MHDNLLRLAAIGRSSSDSGGLGLPRSVSRSFIVLVAPILNALGWRLSPPDFWFVPVNGDDGDARVVHYLRSSEDSRLAGLAVETRALGSDIRSGVDFHLSRCESLGVPIFAITDGRWWHLYPIVSGIRAGSPLAMCDLFSEDSSDIEAMSMLRCGGSSSADGGVVASRSEWISLPDYDIRGLDKPSAIMFPDGSVSDRLRYVYDVQRFVVDWLCANGHLSAEMCPITTRRGSALVNTEPCDANGKVFRNHARTDTGLFVNTARVASGQLRAAVDLIEALGMDAESFRCRRLV